jgi:hypothetical protein
MISLRRSTGTIGRASGQGHGWKLVGPRGVEALPAAYQSYIAGSSAGILCARLLGSEHRMVQAPSHFLPAAGQPVLAEDTRFADDLPAGEGLPTFSDLDEATAGAAEAQCGTSSQVADRKAASGVP